MLCRRKLDWWTEFSFPQFQQKSWSARKGRLSSPSVCSLVHLSGRPCTEGGREGEACLVPQSYPRKDSYYKLLSLSHILVLSYGITSNPCSRPMSIMSLAWLGTIVITWKACSTAAVSSIRPALWLCFKIAWKCEFSRNLRTFLEDFLVTSSNMWYFVSLWIGLIRRSVKRNLNPYFNLISWKERRDM